MPVGELFLGAFLQVLLDRLAPREFMQFLQQEGLETKINNWKEKFDMIKDVLADAEEKQLTQRAVTGWLEKLQDLAYDAEDMLDELEYEATARKTKMDQLQSSKFWKHVPAGFFNWSLDSIRFRFRMRSKVNDVTTRFNELCQLRQGLGLQVNKEGAPLRSSATPQITPSSSVATGAVCGRDADKEKILEMVLKKESNDSNILAIPIVGMGGVGKTALAKEVYNDKEVQSFEVKAWVCVSDGAFDVTRISMSILKGITKSASDHKDFNTVQNELKQIINGKKFLLVLDDIWNINYTDWETLLSPFTESARGSRIIVTTRDKQVASTIKIDRFHPLGVLSDQDCWSVFSGCMSEKEAVLAYPDFNSIQKKVIERCKGLPLAAKILGGVLRSKPINGWSTILDSGLWNLPENERHGIAAVLKLSYHHLPSHLRQCFAYCSIFPKDYEFEIEEVVLFWIGEGLVQQSTENKQPEDFGREYFDDLAGKSLFQQSSSENGHKFVMHDLVHDLAQWAFGERCLRLDGVSAANGQSEGLKKVRHCSYNYAKYDGQKRFEVFQEVKDLTARIRTFFPIPEKYFYRYITRSCPFDLLPKFKRLRVLSLQKYFIVEVPISIGGLKHLRYLNLSGTVIKSLPESTCLLYNLQILLLRDCSHLKKWPSNFKYLIKLRHLDIKGADSIEEMPLGIDKLQNLQNLSNFIVGEGVCSNLKDLMNLSMLRGKLRVSGLLNVISCDHKILSNKKDLRELSLNWGYSFHESQSEVTKKKVLTILQPHETLQELTIKGYGGTKLPRWVGDASYSNMKVLKFKSCMKCTALPSLGVLGSLEKLIIKGMEGLTCISSEFYGNGLPFKSLKTLCFEQMPVWADWEPIEENKHIDAFPCLEKLSIKRCPRLSGSLPRRLSALEKLVIKYCKQLVVSFPNVPKLCKIKINGCRRIACDNPVDFKSIRYLKLSNISEFSNQLMQECFGKAELQQIKPNRSEDQLNEIYPVKPLVGGLQSIRFLTELVISKCPNIVSFPEVCSLRHLSKLWILHCNNIISLPEEMKIKNTCLESLEISGCESLAFIVRGQLPPSLKTLEISQCEKLESLWDDRENDKNTNSSLLESLRIKRCDSLTFIVRGQLPPSLKWLEIVGCEKLESFWDDRENGNDTNSPLLEDLRVFGCPSLTCLSSIIQLPATLKHLAFDSCPQLTELSQSGLLPASLKHLRFSSCGQLSTITEGFHDSNTSLEVIEIVGCENLQITNGLHNLRHLRDLKIIGCPSVESFPDGGLATTNLRRLQILRCEKLKALPIGLRSLNFLEELEIRKCPSITSFNPEEEFPTNLKSLVIAKCENVCGPLVEWGLHNLTSLTFLSIYDIPQQDMEMMFPPSLTHLSISGFPKLTSQGFQNLTSLQYLNFSGCPDLTSLGDQGLPSSLKILSIWNCENLTSLGDQGLPSSLKILSIWNCKNLTSLGDQGLPSSLKILSIWNCENLTCFPKQSLPSSLCSLKIYNSPKLKEECKRNKGREWSKISNIPEVMIDFVHPELEENEEAESSSWSCLTNPMHCC